MRPLVAKIKPVGGFAHLLYLGLLVLLPATIFIMVRLHAVPLALTVVVLSKWRIFAVRPRFWLANVRASSIDLTVGLATVVFMVHSGDSFLLQLVWAAMYGVWLISIKPASGIFWVSIQAFIGQLSGLMALYMIWGASGPLYGLTLVTGLICFISARHFFDSFEEPYAKLLAYLWGYFGAALAWLLGHWLLFYNIVAQPTLLLSTLGYGMAAIYYLDHKDKLSKGVRRQFIFIMLAIVLVVLTFSDWGDKAV